MTSEPIIANAACPASGIIALEAANPFAALKRRQVGKREWKLSIQEILESERSDLARLRRLRGKYANDAETQRLVAELCDEKSERVIKLNELLHYGEGKQEAKEGKENADGD